MACFVAYVAWRMRRRMLCACFTPDEEEIERMKRDGVLHIAREVRTTLIRLACLVVALNLRSCS